MCFTEEFVSPQTNRFKLTKDCPRFSFIPFEATVFTFRFYAFACNSWQLFELVFDCSAFDQNFPVKCDHSGRKRAAYIVNHFGEKSVRRAAAAITMADVCAAALVAYRWLIDCTRSLRANKAPAKPAQLIMVEANQAPSCGSECRSNSLGKLPSDWRQNSTTRACAWSVGLVI